MYFGFADTDVQVDCDLSKWHKLLVEPRLGGRSLTPCF